MFIEIPIQSDKGLASDDKVVDKTIKILNVIPSEQLIYVSEILD